ncbi:acetyl-CoA acetyltransferase [Metarhizium robertsii]|nr:acetyl-CoA acetyltransferase [Metarhizium robertsii]
MATQQPAVPIIVGVGDVRNKSFKVEDAIEPAQLMVNAVRRAVDDSGLDHAAQESLLAHVDSLRVVPTWTWAYNDLPGVISHRLGIKPTRRVLGEHGGNQPALQCDEAARDIAARRSLVSVLTGGEALASRKSFPLAACQKAGENPPKGWLEPDPNGKQLASLDLSILKESSGTLHSMGLPIHVYPLYENGRRAHRGLSAAESAVESAKMYAEFDRIGSENVYSWNYQQPPKTAEQIGLVSKKNRMICDPYPLLMNAFNGVNLSAACILTSTEHAKKLGIPQDRWIYVLGGAGTHEKDNFWERRHLHHSEAITKSIDAALHVSGLSASDVDCYDFYSCFPIVPKLACDHVGLSTTSWQKPITLLGGLTSFGGAGNNYSMHAITAMARELRAKRHGTGLILANGGMLTHQHALCLSARPRGDGQAYPTSNPLPEVVDGYSPPFVEAADGTATIETYTIEYNRDGTPGLGLIVGRLRGTGRRFLANHGDEQTLSQLAMTAAEHVGKTGSVRTGEDGRNLFFLDAKTKL